MTYEMLLLTAACNAVLCAGIVFVCFCRVGVMRKDTKTVFRALYVLMGTTALASALQPVTPPFYSWPSAADIASNAVLLFWLASGWSAWRQAPAYTRKEQAMPVEIPETHLRQVVGGRGAP